MPRISLVRHSDQPVEGVGVGTLLRSNRDMGGSIFDNSRILLYQHEQGEGCQGVVLNKHVVSGDQKRRLGGPVDVRQRVYLHNVADLQGATRVVDGVYYGGNIEEAKGRQGARVEAFYGYAAWFDGQLDGEIRNDDWIWSNEVPASLVFSPADHTAGSDGGQDEKVTRETNTHESKSQTDDIKDKNK